MSRRVPIPCPTCGEPMTRVVVSQPRQHAIRRRRECPNGHRAWTREAVETPREQTPPDLVA